MSGTTPFSLRIFVVDGDPDGLRVIDRTNWNGKALVFPRTLLPKVIFLDSNVYEDINNVTVPTSTGTTQIDHITLCRASGALVLRATKSGAGAGSQFYGCSGFPKCRYVKKLEI